MVHYPKSAVTSKKGINFIRSIVEGSGSLFHKIDQENDLGIDAVIEFIRKGRPLGKQVALQIKKGATYFVAKKKECILPVASHRDYWLEHDLRVLGIVYVPAIRRAHWVDIKRYLKRTPDANTIRFPANESSRFDKQAFRSFFLPAMLKETPDVPLPRAVILTRSRDEVDAYAGIVTLFRRYPNRRETWNALVYILKSRPTDQIPPVVAYYLAHIPWHGDIAHFGEAISDATRRYGRSLIERFGEPEFLKLLELIDDESMITRGSVGQSVESVISSIPDFEKRLESIALGQAVSSKIRERAALILAMHAGRSSTPVLRTLAATGSDFAEQLVRQLKRFGRIDPY